jgi:hypothetical protein
VLMPPTARNGVDAPRRLALGLHADLSAYDPLQDRRQSAMLGLPLRAAVVKPPFAELPQHIPPSGDQDERI